MLLVDLYLDSRSLSLSYDVCWFGLSHGKKLSFFLVAFVILASRYSWWHQ